MKKVSIIVLVLMATLMVISCNQQKRPQYHSLSALTHLVLLERDAGGYTLYDPIKKIELSDVDTAYVGMHQILCKRGNLQEIYNLKGTFLFYAPQRLYIFESTAGTFYVVEGKRGFKWRTETGGEETYIFDEELEEMLKNSVVMKDFPICRLIDEKYYPKKR